MMNQPRRKNWAAIGRCAGRLTAGAAALLSLAMLTGCPKPPPPPDPEPEYVPPPPPPAQVSLSDLMQEMRTDPRVQAAADVVIWDESFARAIIDLADAIARGDDSKLQRVLDARAGAHLVSLVDEGAWADSTQAIEAVRIVYAGSYDGGAIAGGMAGGVSGAMSQMLEIIRQGLDAGGGEGIFEYISRQMAGQISPEQIEEARRKYEQFSSLKPDEFVQKLQEEMTKIAGAMPDMPAPDLSAMAGGTATHGVLIALQDARGAYLLGWGATNTGDGWVFSNAPAAEGERPRASAWDGIGLSGFQYTTMTAGALFDDLFADLPGALPGGAPPGSSNPAGPSSEPGREPGRKNTPSGPVNIPGGS
jgi:uncharacterized protein YidB (DUF937 family)